MTVLLWDRLLVRKALYCKFILGNITGKGNKMGIGLKGRFFKAGVLYFTYKVDRWFRNRQYTQIKFEV